MERNDYLDGIQCGPMSDEQDRACAESLLDGKFGDEEGATILVALAERGESAAKIIAFANAILARAVAPPDVVVGRGIDLAGTGGSGLDRFNVSTTAALLTASLGAKVVKHGNRGSRQPNGSFDFLEQLQMPFDLAPETMAAVYQQADLALFFARAWHPAMAAVVGARKAAGRRTIFNLAAPLCNPASPPFQVLGASDGRVAETLIQVLNGLGRERALVMCGHPGIEDFSTSGSTEVWELRDGEVSSRTVTPEELGVAVADYEALPRGDRFGGPGTAAPALPERRGGLGVGASDRHQYVAGFPVQQLLAGQPGDGDRHGDRGQRGAGLLDQPAGSRQCPAGGQHVVHQQHAHARCQCVGM